MAIESKKNDGTTLKEKEVACTEICKRYNESTMIDQEIRIMINNVLT